MRLTVEALFLAALALALAFTELRPLAIVGLMALGWLVVALYEWVATREQPHYGSGLPPRYYVPQVSLPPPRPLEQLPSGYPVSAEARDDAPTWIASPAIRSEVFTDWPVANPVPAARAEDTMVDDLMTASAGEERAIDPWFDELDDPALASDPQVEPSQNAASPVAAAEEEQRPEVDSVVLEEDEMEEELAGRAEREDEALVAAEPVPATPVEAGSASPAARLERHRFDPIANGAGRRRPWQRRLPEESGSVDVPARPEHAHVLPGGSRREN